jgi:hypothetical protein
MQENNQTTFKEFLTELFELNPIDFGTNYPDLSDKNYKTYKLKNYDVVYTFFKRKEIYYCVSLCNNGEISFSSSKTFSDDYKKYSYETLKIKNAIRIFSSVIYIILFFSKKFNIKILMFAGENKNLEDMYSRMVKNKSFVKLLDEAGFELKKHVNEKSVDDFLLVRSGFKKRKLFIFEKM